MAETVRTVDYYYASVPNKPGEGARVLGLLRDAGVNLRAFHAFPTGRRAQLDLVPEDARALKAAARKAGLELSARKPAFLVEGDDRPGVAAGLLDKLAGAGVNVTAMDAVVAGGGRFGALLWVAPADIRKATSALGAS